jgi:hypothetical protein
MEQCQLRLTSNDFCDDILVADNKQRIVAISITRSKPMHIFTYGACYWISITVIILALKKI